MEYKTVLLELGRDVMVDLLLRQRGDLRELGKAEPKLAKQFDGLRQEFDPFPKQSPQQKS